MNKFRKFDSNTMLLSISQPMLKIFSVILLNIPCTVIFLSNQDAILDQNLHRVVVSPSKLKQFITMRLSVLVWIFLKSTGQLLLDCLSWID